MSNPAPIYHYLKPSTKSLLRRNQTQSVEEEKTWSQGPGNKGPEAGFQGSWGGERRESRGLPGQSFQAAASVGMVY